MSTAWQTNEGGTDVLRFERRDIDRWPVHGIATAFRLGGDRFGEMHELSMLDYSHGGLGCACSEAIEPGTVISMGFQAPGYTAKRGTVVQCVPTGNGYRIGIRFESMMAA